MEEKQERQQSKRERKASEVSSTYAFGHSSADAVLIHYMQSDKTHDGPVSGDEVEEQIHKFRGLKNQQKNKRRIEIIDVDDLEEDDHKLADEKKRIEDEWTVCYAVEDDALLQNNKKRRKDLWSSFESDHHVNNDGGKGSFWYTNLEDSEAQCVSNQPISKSEDMITNSVLNIENHHQGDNNCDGYFQDKDLEDSNVLCVSTELISNSKDILLLENISILSNISTLNFESDHGNDNGGDEYFWDKDLEDASPLSDSTQLISKFEDILPNSSPLISFETNQHHHVVGDHHGNRNANGESFSWYIDLEDDKAQCVPNHNDGERDIWNKDLEDGKALCVATQLGSKSEDILLKSLPLSFESNNHRDAVDDEKGNNNGDNGIFSTNLEDGNA
ncbi:unnamed protein product [Malus baccata var. baccata]